MSAPTVDPRPAERLRGLASLVGNTPLLAIDYECRGARRVVYAKAEHLNLTGSIKDRMAMHILRRGYATGTLEAGARIIEATSGNTGISFAALGRALGHPVTIFMPEWMSTERIDLIRSLGASIVLISHEEGGFLGCIARAEALARETPGAFLPKQFSNRDNVEAHYVTTGPEILGQLAAEGRVPAAFVAGVGTGGTIMGAGAFLRKHARIRQRCRTATRPGITGSRGSPTNSSRRSWTSISSMPFSPWTMETRS